MKRWQWWLGLMLGLFVWQLIVTWPSDRLYIVQCDVGQGDATLVTRNTTQVLIDGGPPNNKVLQCLAKYMPFWDRRIELVVATHPDADHIGGLVEVFTRYNVDTLVVPDYVHNTELFWQFYGLAKKSRVVTAKEGQQISIADMDWRVIWPEKTYGEPLVWEYDFTLDNKEIRNEQMVQFVRRQPKDGNTVSVVMELSYGKLRGLFTGDVGVAEEKQIIKRNLLKPVHILKVGHHGSKTSTSVDLLEQITPQYGLIGVGKDNRYGHPHTEVVQRLRDFGVEVLSTDVLGTVEMWTNGEIIFY